MRIQQKRNKVPFIIAGVLIVAVAAAGSYFFFVHNDQSTSDNTSSTDYNPPSDAQIEDGNEAKKNTIENDNGSTSKNAEGTTESQNELNVQITAASVEDDVLYVRNDNGGIFDSGTCTLTLTNGSKTVTKTSGIQALPQSSTCQGFNVPVSELGNGTWTLTLTVNASNKSGTDTEKVTI